MGVYKNKLSQPKNTTQKKKPNGHNKKKMSRGKNVCNYVHQDEIWKDHVRTERTAGKKWPNKWGYTTVIYNSLEDSLTGRSDEHTSRFAKELNRQYAIIHDAQRIESDPEKRKRFASKSNRRLTLKPISQALPPSLTVDDKALTKVSSRNDMLSRPKFYYPKSTSDEIGWQGKNFKFETYGKVDHRARGKHTLYKKLGWPIESQL